MKLGLSAIFVVLVLGAIEARGAEKKISVLIVDGMNNHDWPRATGILRSIYEASGRFRVDVSTTPPTPPTSQPADAWNAWRPDFSKYDVVVSNFNGGYNPAKGAVHWPRDVEIALENYVKNGGGGGGVHAATNSLPGWP